VGHSRGLELATSPGNKSCLALTEEHGNLLISAAGKSLASALIHQKISYPDLSEADLLLSSPGASFVTYEHKESLVGCIGSIDRELPLVLDVCRNAILAAFADPRTPGITAVPLGETTMKIAVLSEPEPLEFSDFDELVAAVSPGKDGLIIESGERRATLLPAVWDKVGSVEEFLDVLWLKAGLDKRTVDSATKLSRYATVDFVHPNVDMLVRNSLASN
jgi:AmmeMemoRadiSam system protein A